LVDAYALLEAELKEEKNKKKNKEKTRGCSFLGCFI